MYDCIGVHIGKVLVQTSKGCADEPSNLLAAPERRIDTAPDSAIRVRGQFSARRDRSYVITGGLGGFGLALAVWLARQGAGHIVLSSKR